MRRVPGRTALTVAALAFAGAVTACGPRPTRHEMEIRGLAFPAPPPGLRPGDTLVWVNRDLVPHTVTAEGSWDSGEVAPGGTFTLVVEATGGIRYLCRYHPTMTGSLDVR